MFAFLAELNDLDFCADDIGNTYLEYQTNDNVPFVGGK